MKSKIWYWTNGIFLSVTLLAVFNISNPAIYLMYAMGWFAIITSWMMKAVTAKYVTDKTLVPPDILYHQTPSVPIWLNYGFDMLILVLLIFGGYYVFALFYATHIPVAPSIFKDMDILLDDGRIQIK
jgi:hypothetical protein